MLSEIPHLWRTAVNRWARLNRRHRREVDGQPAPSRNDEYLFYQSLVGVWPLAPPDDAALRQLVDRLQAYMEKATHEAKVHTSWINPNSDYDAAVREFVAAALDDHPKNRFLARIPPLSRAGRELGALTRTLADAAEADLARRARHLPGPGALGLQPGGSRTTAGRWILPTAGRCWLGCESDHRPRAIRRWLALARQLAQNPRDPRLKLFVTWRVLQFRRRHAELFQLGDYIPLDVQGPRARHVCAFARRVRVAFGAGPKIAIVIVPRLIAQLTPLATDSSPAPPPVGSAIWEDTHVLVGDWASSRLENLFTGQLCSPQDSRVAAAAALSDFPVALLTNAGGVSGELG